MAEHYRIADAGPLVALIDSDTRELGKVLKHAMALPWPLLISEPLLTVADFHICGRHGITHNPVLMP
ncbi:MAG: hypothetical protein O2854_06380 [Chloroflexi bacterium]|nr:hypothetical protein [Chloroflexota bacterium]